MLAFCRLVGIDHADDDETKTKAWCNKLPLSKRFKKTSALIGFIDRVPPRVCKDDELFEEYVADYMLPLVDEEEKHEMIASFGTTLPAFKKGKAFEDAKELLLEFLIDKGNDLKAEVPDFFDLDDAEMTKRVASYFEVVPGTNEIFENMIGFQKKSICMSILNAIAVAISRQPKRRKK